MHQPLCCGLELCLDPDPNPENIVSSYLQYKPKHLLVGPPHYINMMHDKRMQRSRFDQIESLGSGGEKLSKATELSRHIHYKKEDLKDIKYYEDHYSDYPFQLKLMRTKDGVFSYIDIYDEDLKKEIINLVKIHFIADIQKSEKELEQL